MSSARKADPRPLLGEPLAIDLLNTRWIDGDARHDLLDSLDGLATWLGGAPVRQALGEMAVPVGRDTLTALLQARDALDRAVANPGKPTEEVAAAVNAVLAHGRTRQELRADGPHTVVEADAPFWLPAWSAVADYLRLLAEHPERIRPCANQECVLHFYDVSKNGTRRWCSMAGCGNRAKARRHVARHRED